MEPHAQRTWRRRLIPVFAGVCGALLAGALFGIFASVFGFATGFLVGAFGLSLRHVRRALGHGPREAAMHREAMSQLRAMGALGPMRLAAPPARRSSAELARAIASMETLATTDLSAAIDAGKGLRAAYPKAPSVLARLAVFEQAAGRDEDARTTAVEAMVAALAIGATRVALDLYDDFSEDLHQLDASATTFAALAQALARKGRLDAAASCVARAREVGTRDPHVERTLITLESEREGASPGGGAEPR